MIQLAIDTSTDFAGIALVQDSVVLAELTWHCGRNHSVELLPRLADLLKQAALNIKDVSHIIVAKGPGSYNGLRVGISTAKGLAFGLGVPLVGVGTLEVEAYPHAETGLPICAIANAGRTEVAAALYQKKRNKWCELSPPHIATVDALCAEIKEKTLFCGEFLPGVAATIKRKLRSLAVMPASAALLRRAVFLAELGRQRIEAGDFDNPASLQPVYLRQPQITQPKRKY